MSEIEKESNLSCKGMRLKTKLPPPPWLYPRGTIRYVAKTLNCLLHCPSEVIMGKESKHRRNNIKEKWASFQIT